MSVDVMTRHTNGDTALWGSLRCPAVQKRLSLHALCVASENDAHLHFMN